MSEWPLSVLRTAPLDRPNAGSEVADGVAVLAGCVVAADGERGESVVMGGAESQLLRG